MNEKLKFVKVVDNNFNDFVLLLDKMAIYEKHEPLDDEAKNRLKKDALSDHPKYEAYLFFIEQEPMGYTMFYMTYSSYLALPVLHVEDLFILVERRRKGYGEEVFRFCANKAKKKGCGRMEWTVFDWNEPAIQFYKKIKATALKKKYYRMDRQQIDNFLLTNKNVKR
jgi:predicted acetyltransferase